MLALRGSAMADNITFADETQRLYSRQGQLWSRSNALDAVMLGLSSQLIVNGFLLESDPVFYLGLDGLRTES